IAALFGQPNNYQRLLFDTLRKEEFWPKDEYKFGENSVAIIYASPVHKASGIIGDFGTTIYKGKDKRILDHLNNCLNTLKKSTDQIETGMEFREIHDLTQKIIAQNNLTNARTITWTDTVGTNLGHTIPWTYENPTAEEEKIIASNNVSE